MAVALKGRTLQGEPATIMLSGDLNEVVRVLADHLGVEPVWDLDNNCDLGPVSGVVSGAVMYAGVRDATHTRNGRKYPLWVHVYTIQDGDPDHNDARYGRDADAFIAERERLTDEAGRLVYGWLAEGTDGPMRMMSTHDEWVASRPGPAESTTV